MRPRYVVLGVSLTAIVGLALVAGFPARPPYPKFLQNRTPNFALKVRPGGWSHSTYAMPMGYASLVSLAKADLEQAGLILDRDGATSQEWIGRDMWLYLMRGRWSYDPKRHVHDFLDADPMQSTVVVVERVERSAWDRVRWRLHLPIFEPEGPKYGTRNPFPAH